MNWYEVFSAKWYIQNTSNTNNYQENELRKLHVCMISRFLNVCIYVYVVCVCVCVCVVVVVVVVTVFTL